MPNYRRHRAPGATYFFTVTLADRRSSLLTDRIDLLRAAFVAVRQRRPFFCDAFVVLPDHLHAVWTLPPGDCDYSTRWAHLKTIVSREATPTIPVPPSKRARREKGVWQRRFWEHAIRDDADYEHHIAYCHWNPVRHGLVDKPEDWVFSSIHRDLRAGARLPSLPQNPQAFSFGERRAQAA